jgi:uroporphyrinogen decarboxylase
MNKFERLRAALAGEEVDRPPFSLWMHFPDADHDARLFAGRNVTLAGYVDPDFLLSMPSSTFMAENWGTVTNHLPLLTGGLSVTTHFPVEKLEDWRAIRQLDVRTGAMGRELDQLRRLVDAIGKHTPVLPTILSPLTVVKKLCRPAYRTHLEQAPELMDDVLREITATIKEFVRQAMDAGCAGIYFATQEATTDSLTPSLYRRFGRPYDLDVISAASDGWCNVMHAHGVNIMSEEVFEYPVHALHWHSYETAPSIPEYMQAMGAAAKTVIGGLQRAAITKGKLDVVRADVESTMRDTGGRKIIFGPACVIHYPVSQAALVETANVIRSARS